MLFLLFQIGADRYALDAAVLVEVLPLVNLKQIPQAPRGVAGLVNYRGLAVPVVDLTALALGTPAASRVSTRLLIVRHSPPRGGEELLGLLAERATETMRCAPEDFQPTNVDNPSTRWLGPVFRGPRGLVQRVGLGEMLTPELRAGFFPENTEATR